MLQRYYLLLGICLAGQTFVQSSATSLKMLNWEEYLSPNVISKWQDKTGIPLEQVYFDNDDSRDSIMLNAHKHKIDIAVMDEIFTEFFGRRGEFVKLDESNIPNIQYIKPEWREYCGEYGLPYFWGTIGIAYRKDKVSNPPTSWMDLLKPAPELKGHISMLQDYPDLLFPPLMVAGESLEEPNIDALKTAFNVLKAQVPDILTYEYSITYLQTSDMADELYMSQVYSGDQYTMNEIVGKDVWGYTIPKEGSILWVDCLVASTHSDQKQATLDFLNFLHDPNIALLNALDSRFATPNIAAFDLLNDDVRNDEALYPPASVLENSTTYKPVSAEMDQYRQRIANSIMKIYEAK